MKEFDKVLISKEDIAKKVLEISSQLSKDYEGLNPIFICILKGSVFFFADLLRNVTTPAQIDFMIVSSYGSGSTSSGTLNVKKDLAMDIKDKHVIIVDDIIDTGKTIMEVFNIFKTRRVASIELACLLDKPEGRVVDYNPKYVGTTIPKEFVIGYGLDFDELYRNLPFVGVLKEEYYQ